MAAPQTSSRLQLLQARFQQKQLQEKEQKLLQLYDQQQQRAHQVAQRGSAGSNGSNASNGSGHGSAIVNPTGKVRQMFDERRQNNAKGIDKSYPLEPLKKQTMSGRRNTLAKRNSKTELNTGVNSSSSTRATLSTQRENLSRESYASSRTFSKDSIGQRENLSRESYTSTRGESRQVETDNQSFNGQSNNGHRYEINIDEVIDNEAMERNRMLAKFNAAEIEKRRRFVDEFPEDLTDEPIARKSSQTEARGERLKNASVKKGHASPPAQPASTRKRTEQEIPRQSTLMNTTKSASLKIRKLPKRKKTVEDKKKNRREAEEKLKQEITKKVAQVEDPSSNWSVALKSTSLIYQIIRSHTKFEESNDVSKLGKVMTMVTKIEESRKEKETGKEKKEKIESFSETLNYEKGEDKMFGQRQRQREEKDQGDGLVSLEGNLTLTIRGNRECSVEKPTDRQEMTVADQAWVKVKREKDERLEQPRASAYCANRIRRASFELKRLMFEQIQSKEQLARRDSVESALRHFDSIGLDASDSSLEPVPRITSGASGEEKKARAEECTSGAPPPAPLLSTGENSQSKSVPPPTRLCKDLVKKVDPARGFERHTSAWTIRTTRGRQPLAQGKMLSRRKVRDAARLKKSSSKKFFETRDSIAKQLARLFIGAKSPICRSRHLDSPTGKLQPSETMIARVKSQSQKRRAEGKEDKQIFKNDQSLSSTPRRPGELNLKKSPPNGKASESTSKADLASYPHSKSPDNTREQKHRAASKSSSLKFLNQIVGSNEAVGSENGFSSVDTQDSEAFLEDKSFEDEKGLGSTVPRAASSLSSSSSIGANRQQGAGNARQVNSNKAKSNASPAPTPAQRSSVPAKNNTNDESLTTCKICNRRFATERITLHEQICAKTSQKKRKQFDTVTQRVRGTELEPFVAKPVATKKQTKSNAAPPKAAETPKSNWRRKHEDFINAIRSAKQMQAHLAAGGKLSDLPPPPPSDTSDYTQCPHCSRKFNQTAAERHIPKCETMQHNKPRVQPRSIKR